MAGIACAGNWVLDRSKFIKYYPELTGHTTIYRTVSSAGGAALNILVALHQLKVNIPTYGIGLVGKGMRGKELQQMCLEKHINIDYVEVADGDSSYTDAFTLPDGSRTQFHCPGINNALSYNDIPFNALKAAKAKLFYLGHIMILEGMDAKDEEFGTVSARIFHDAQQAGMETIVDVVSNPSLSYKDLVHPVLPYIDHLICNEFEAGQITNTKTINNQHEALFDGIKEAAKKIFALGVKKNVVVHTPKGAYCLTKDGQEYFQASLNIPAEKIVASCGAGDAFCAGILYGLHENWDMQKSMLLAVCTAGASLLHETNGGGIMPLNETLALTEKWPLRDSAL